MKRTTLEIKNVIVSGMCTDMRIKKISKALEAVPQLEKVDLQFSSPQIKVSYKGSIPGQPVSGSVETVVLLISDLILASNSGKSKGFTR